jgi:hypothetical protein
MKDHALMTDTVDFQGAYTLSAIMKDHVFMMDAVDLKAA